MNEALSTELSEIARERRLANHNSLNPRLARKLQAEVTNIVESLAHGLRSPALLERPALRRPSLRR